MQDLISAKEELVDDEAGNPVGLLFAGSSIYTIAKPISKVLSALDVKIIPSI